MTTTDKTKQQEQNHRFLSIVHKYYKHRDVKFIKELLKVFHHKQTHRPR